MERKLTEKMICENAMDFAIEKHLDISETKVEMLKKFNGDKSSLVNFLRDREFSKEEEYPVDVLKKEAENGKNKNIDSQVREQKPLFKVIPGTKTVVPAGTKITAVQSELF